MIVARTDGSLFEQALFDLGAGQNDEIEHPCVAGEADGAVSRAVTCPDEARSFHPHPLEIERSALRYDNGMEL
ncbi:hypothetical protein AA0472_1334 [Acetobacter estunensis NRIC 0472]|nr:hypothetical protein AA0472_1334 [Acetobacter estunensis NRIC 0472]